MSAAQPQVPGTVVMCRACQDAGAAACPHAARATDGLDDGATIREDPMVTRRVQLGDYVIECKLGRGGMGDVYGARHPVIGKRVAIKVLAAETLAHPHAMERFVGEAQAVCAIGHPGIVDIFGFGTLDDGRAYFIMEWLTGQSLRQRLDGGPAVPPADAISIVDGVAEALEAAHAAGVIHRDLKPDNVFLVPTSGGGFRTKLLDFGIAKLSGGGSADDRNRTGTGTVVGTPGYMSPEQARGIPIGPASDVYSLGVMFYELLCGSCPFTDESSVVVMARHVTDEPARPSSRAPGIRADVEALVMAMLGKVPEQRPTIADLRRRLAQVGGGGVAMPARPLAAAAQADVGGFELPLNFGTLEVISLSDRDRPAPDRRNVGAAATLALPATPPATPSVPTRPAPLDFDLELPVAKAPVAAPAPAAPPPPVVARTVTPPPVVSRTATPVAGPALPRTITNVANAPGGGVAVAPARGLPLVPLAIVAIVLLGVAVWFFAIRDGATPPRRAPLLEPVAAPAAPAPTPTTYTPPARLVPAEPTPAPGAAVGR